MAWRETPPERRVTAHVVCPQTLRVLKIVEYKDLRRGDLFRAYLDDKVIDTLTYEEPDDPNDVNICLTEPQRMEVEGYGVEVYTGNVADVLHWAATQ